MEKLKNECLALYYSIKIKNMNNTIDTTPYYVCDFDYLSNKQKINIIIDIYNETKNMVSEISILYKFTSEIKHYNEYSEKNIYNLVNKIINLKKYLLSINVYHNETSLYKIGYTF